MLCSKMSLRAIKSRAYFDSLCKHFARKTEVLREDGSASVTFAMGICNMAVDGDSMRFIAIADDEESLDAVKMIISRHVLRYGELKNSEVVWHAASAEPESQQ